MKLNFYFVECLRGTLLAILFVATLHVSFEANAARLALVIGNDNYEHHPKLRKAGNDADAMAALLKRAGFEVVNDSLRRDLTRLQMNTMFTQLIRRINGGDEVVVFYSGHGLQYGDVSLLTGRDFPKPFERTLALAEAVQLRVWQEEIKRKGARYALFVIDACREDIVDDPMVRSLGEASTIRLAQPPAGQFVLFSASSGQLALDRLSDSDPNPNSVFTRVFLEEAQKPGVAIRDVLEETQERVELLAATVKDRATGLPHRQSPASRNEAGKAKYCLFSQGGLCGVSPTTAAVQRVDPEEEAYGVAKARNTRVAWEAMLAAFPNGRYAGVARIALAEAVAVAVAVASPNPTITASQPVQALPAQPVAARASPGNVFKDCADCPEMVVVPSGSFTMGSNDGGGDEKPRHRVDIASFAMGKTEVTQGQWKALMGSNPSKFAACGDGCPVEWVNWDDAQEYIKRLNAKTGKRYSLPSESQWEYAARSGTTTKWSFGDNEADSVNHGWNLRNSVGTTHEVAQKRPNAFGLYDMHGNVWEWTEDCWHTTYAGAPSDGSAWITNCMDGNTRVLRGGSWLNDPLTVSTAFRSSIWFADIRNYTVGFRVARSVSR